MRTYFISRNNDGSRVFHQASCITWFVVRTRQGALTPFHVRVNQSARQALPDKAEVDALRGLMEMVKDDVTRIDFMQLWRPFTCIVDGQAQGDALSKVIFQVFLPLFRRQVVLGGIASHKNMKVHL